jgi:hypothetical protein
MYGPSMTSVTYLATSDVRQAIKGLNVPNVAKFFVTLTECVHRFARLLNQIEYFTSCIRLFV